MVVQGEDGAVVGLAGEAQVDGGLAAVAADLENGAEFAGDGGLGVQGQGLVVFEEAFDVVDV